MTSQNRPTIAHPNTITPAQARQINNPAEPRFYCPQCLRVRPDSGNTICDQCQEDNDVAEMYDQP